jgi:transcriptional regulator with XRE-family HTH domain
MARHTPLLPLAARRALAQLGSDIQRARKRRRLTTAMVAERAQISRPTLLRVERGDAAVSLGAYATVLWVLGMGDRVGTLAASETDLVGIGLEDERLPQRVSSGAPRRKQVEVEVANDRAPSPQVATNESP